MRIDCCISYFQKQLIGLLPNGQECLFYYAPDINIDGYRIDGIIYDDYTVIDADLNPNGIYYNLSYIPSSGEPRFVLTYVGTEPPTYLPSITDSNGDPVVWNWTNYCTKVCLEGTFSALDSTFFENGYGWNSYGVAAFDDQVVVETFLKSLYGQQTLYSYVDNGDGTFYIKIDNAFILSPIAWSADDVTYQDMVACGYVPPPAPKCYWFAEYFSAPDYDFNSWTINGNPFNTEIYNITGDASYSLNPLSKLAIYDSRFPWIITDDPLSLPTIPTALDSFGNSNTPTWQQAGCDLVCWELLVPKTDLQFLTIYFGIPMVNFLDCQAYYNSLSGLGVQNAGQIAQLDSLYKSMFGAQASVTSTLDSNGDYIVRINNTYEGFAPFWGNTTLGTLVFIQVSC